jgi:hypothetical protein
MATLALYTASCFSSPDGRLKETSSAKPQVLMSVCSLALTGTQPTPKQYSGRTVNLQALKIMWSIFRYRGYITRFLKDLKETIVHYLTELVECFN